MSTRQATDAHARETYDRLLEAQRKYTRAEQKRDSALAERYTALIEAREAGNPVARLADGTGMSRQRVSQILARWYRP